jgi:glycosyltransferase involved in cell wall biosynthesis
MKVLHVIDSLALAGAETLVKDLVLKAGEFGMTAEVYALKTSGTALEFLLQQKGKVVFSGGLKSVYDPRHVRRCAAHLAGNFYDVVHVHLFPAQLWVAMAAKAVHNGQTTFVTTEHSTENRRRKRILKPIDRWMYRQYASVACISERTREHLVAWLPELSSCTPVIANGIDTARFAQASPAPSGQIGTDREKALILCVGRLETAKGQDVLIRAIAMCDGVELALVGDGVRRNELARLVRQLNVSHRVHFLGLRTDVPELLKSADIYVQPSLWEGFGIAALEAMAAGLPVIASDVPGLSDVVGDAGVLVPKGSPESLAKVIQQLSKDAPRRQQLGTQCAERASRFDIIRTAEQYAALYSSVRRHERTKAGS